MSFGAGLIAAEMHKAGEIIDPRPFASGTLKYLYENYPHIGAVLPAMGYGPDQIIDLEKTIAASNCDLVLFATPIHLPLILNISKPTLRVRYEYQDHGAPTLEDVLLERIEHFNVPDVDIKKE
jgi:predicted GTPase